MFQELSAPFLVRSSLSTSRTITKTGRNAKESEKQRERMRNRICASNTKKGREQLKRQEQGGLKVPISIEISNNKISC